MTEAFLEGSYGLIKFEIDLESEDPINPVSVLRSREYLGMTQVVFAEVLGVSERLVIAWERKRKDHVSRNCSGPARKLIIKLVEEKKEKVNQTDEK